MSDNTELPHTKKSLGQHWLTDPNSLTAICEAAQLYTTDTVLEIGPGAGTLTAYLVRNAKEVVAVEFDAALAEQLPQNVTASNLRIETADIRRFDLTQLPTDYKVVANIPYYLTSNLIRLLSETVNRPSRIVLLIQKEVAERVCAQPGAMSVLSVTAQYYWQASLGVVVPAVLFVPPPKVDSQVLVMQRPDSNPYADLTSKEYFRAVKMAFANRRKTLLNSLSGGLHMSKADTQNILEEVGVNPLARPQELSLDDWHAIATIINT